MIDREESVRKLKHDRDVLKEYKAAFGKGGGLSEYSIFIDGLETISEDITLTYDNLMRKIKSIEKNMKDSKKKSTCYENHNLDWADQQIIKSYELIKDSVEKVMRNMACNCLVYAPLLSDGRPTVEGYDEGDYKNAMAIKRVEIDFDQLLRSIPNIRYTTAGIEMAANTANFQESIDSLKKFVEKDMAIDSSKVNKRDRSTYDNFNAVIKLHETVFKMVDSMDVPNKDYIKMAIERSFSSHRAELIAHYNDTSREERCFYDSIRKTDCSAEISRLVDEAVDSLPKKHSIIRKDYSDRAVIGDDPKKVLIECIEAVQDGSRGEEEISGYISKVYELSEHFKDSPNLRRLCGRLVSIHQSMTPKSIFDEDHNFVLGYIDGIAKQLKDGKKLSPDEMFDCLDAYERMLDDKKIRSDDPVMNDIPIIINKIGESYDEFEDLNKAIKFAKNRGSTITADFISRNKKTLQRRKLMNPIFDDFDDSTSYLATRNKR